MISMTGHGRGENRTKTWTAVVECHSVNRKTAEVILHSDRAFAWLEPAVRERALERIARGRVQVNLVLSQDTQSAEHFLDEARVAAFVSEARKLQKKLQLAGDITISDILAFPGMARSSEPPVADAKETVLKALDKALDGLVATRAREGAALQKILKKSSDRLASLLKKITPFAKGVAERYRETLHTRIHSAGLGLLADDPRIATEVAIFAERCDITEELDRAASHIVQFQEKIASEGPVGRTLEFLAQELGREFNTIGSKSGHTAIARLVIDAKSELDRIREQLANIE